MKAIDHICKNCALADPMLCVRRSSIHRVEKLREVISTRYADTLDLLIGIAVCPGKREWMEEATDE